MSIPRKAGIVITVLCIMALVIAAASAADTPGPAGQKSPETGSKQPGTGPDQQQQQPMANNNVNQSGPINGGATPGQGPGRGPVNVTNQGQGNGQKAGNVSRQEQEQGTRMPVEDVIAQLEQKGYDVSEVRTLLQSGDREAVKTWLDTFKKSNPGVAEAIEGTGTNNPQGQKTGSGNSNPGVSSEGPVQNADKNIFDIIISWFSHL